MLRAYVGDRGNRRHRPGRAFERATYAFDVLSDYGAFRDLQRHRILSIDWQELTPAHGYVAPAAIEEVGALTEWRRVMDESAQLHEDLSRKHLATGRAVRCLDGLSHPLLHAHERPGGDARHRAANGAAGPSGLPSCVPDDAPADRRPGRSSSPRRPR